MTEAIPPKTTINELALSLHMVHQEVQRATGAEPPPQLLEAIYEYAKHFAMAVSSSLAVSTPAEPSARAPQALPTGWRFERQTDNSGGQFIAIWGPIPGPDESPRQNDAVFRSQTRDLYDLLGRLADHQAAAPVDEARERELFEAKLHAKLAPNYSKLGRWNDSGEYILGDVQMAWTGWLTRAQLVASETGPAEGAKQRLQAISDIAHYGGLADLDAYEFSNAIRRLTLPEFRRDCTPEEAKAFVLSALATLTAQSKPQEDK